MAHTPDPPARAGFTLVELSIVLVVLGLLVGGVLAGRELIGAAKLRGQIGQVGEFDTAFATFQLKFDCTPGDCANAVEYGLGTAAGPGDNGDGNGRIYSDAHMTQWAGGMKEALNAGYHLQRAGLIAGTVAGHDFGNALFDGVFNGRAVPGKLNKTTSVSPLTVGPGGVLDGNMYLLHGADPGNPCYTNGMTATDASAIDKKLDDGSPATGGVVNFYPYSGPYIAGAPCGCSVPAGAELVYDVAGTWQNYCFQVPNTPPNPGYLGCGLAVRAAW